MTLNHLMTRTARLSAWAIRHRVLVLVVVGLLTLGFAATLAGLDIRTRFSDMVPHDHPYVKVHQKYQDSFAASNRVTILVKAKEGDIFRQEILGEVRRITYDLQQVEGVNPMQITSLASKKLKRVNASSEGIETRPLMWPDLPKDAQQMRELRQAVLNNPLVYGLFVDRELSSALIQVDFYDHLVDYAKIFPQIQAILDASPVADQVSLHMVGEPILYGWVAHYLDETVGLAILSLAAMLVLLFVFSRTWRGTLLPLIAGVVSAIWALGIGTLLGYNFDPLVIVVAFIITARAFSHSVQMITRFDDLVQGEVLDARKAAEQTMRELFRPSMLGLYADAGAILCVMLTPIPLLHKVAIVGALWVMSIAVSAVFVTPALLSYIRRPQGHVHPLNLDGFMRAILAGAKWMVRSRARYWVAPVTLVALAGFMFEATRINVGDASDGSPILWADSPFNRDSALINQLYPGSEQMFVVLEGEELDAMKRPEVLDWMLRFSRYMERQPEIGGTVSLADIVIDIRRNLYEGNPRYGELGATRMENGELISFYMQGADPDDLTQFADVQFHNAAVTLFFRDHKGDTLRKATHYANQFIADNPIEGVEVKLFGGVLGIIAAVNEILLADQIEATALAFLVVVICCLCVYRSSVSGIFFIIPVLISNVVTFAFMAWQGIGMSISTLPVVALGIGLGVDYAFYIVDSMKEYLEKHPDADPLDAVLQSLGSAGRGVLLTAFTLSAGVLFWSFSSLRFQAEMGMLIGLWLAVSALTSLFVMPSLALVFKPKFIFGHGHPKEARESGHPHQPEAIGN
ncbi:efflux RND transporter permease subunit [Pseudomonas paralcaligenes]|uniref:efflux RND transporter permease subunit n=1 Tax=Pseudomonas paralcaligenes TaxID=2772558 RepID=UPI0021D15515|nr:efflux RND transporter permease subunit [Pseudomonas paralcaligenes]